MRITNTAAIGLAYQQRVMSENANLLKSNKVFAQLTEAEIEEVLSICKEFNYNKSDLVFAKETMPRYLFLVKKGTFILNLPSNHTKTMGVGALFGEIGIINQNFRTGSVRAREDGTVLAISGEKLFEEKFIKPTTALKILRTLSAQITGYLRSREEISTLELIRQGESDMVEFKSSLRWNNETEKKDKRIEFASLKTIAAFLNTEGGTLLIGVSDDMHLLGLENDQFSNEDKMLLHLNELIKAKIGTIFTSFVHTDIEKIDGKWVLRVDCESSTIPAYLKESNTEYFFVRTGPSTTNLALSKIYRYIRVHFYNETDILEHPTEPTE